MSTVAERYGEGDADHSARHAHRPDPYAGDPYAGDPYVDPHGDNGDAAWEPSPPSGAVVTQYRAPAHDELRADFGAHLETHYARLVAQLYAITLHPGDAHEAVQDAYSRAWRRWSELDPDETLGWIRRVAVSTSARGWRTGLNRVGLRRSRLPGDDAVEPETAVLLRTLDRLGAPVRRAIVLRHMVAMSVTEIAELERVEPSVVRARLASGRAAVTEGMAGRVAEGLAATGEGAGYDSAGYDSAVDDADGWLSRGRAGGDVRRRRESGGRGRHGMRGARGERA